MYVARDGRALGSGCIRLRKKRERIVLVGLKVGCLKCKDIKVMDMGGKGKG